ncbi:hypothetical protein HHK36_001260 [Tetracentron sinense]|uniref:Plastid division protein PDV1 n=1 Tax=Tetracentron sinense TaxID=13715 RepID=A0A835DUM2_TETSI|nr:hypothetical protein HHK36_001260 [Tetracentron sinense]
MKWGMEIEEIEAVLEKIWDLHDKLSDTIHAISRKHFLSSIKTLIKNSDEISLSRNYEIKRTRGDGEDNRSGFVFVKDLRFNGDAVIAEAKSIDSIRTALENLEDQLEFFHTVQSHQQAERDAAIARFEQSRIVLARRLANHQGKKYKVIEEALAFVGDEHGTNHFVSPENLFGSLGSQSSKNLEAHEGKRSNFLFQLLVSSFNFVKKSLKLDQMGGVPGNAALVAVSMLALLHIPQVAFRNNFVIELPQMQEYSLNGKRNVKNTSRLEDSSPSGHMNHLDVLFARG